jgi:hypothetical protein
MLNPLYKIADAILKNLSTIAFWALIAYLVALGLLFKFGVIVLL